jgi:hypothetical protein
MLARGGLVTLALVASFALPSAAQAAAPVLTVDLSSHYMEASWTLETPHTASYAIEIATSPDVIPEGQPFAGEFLEENTVEFLPLGSSQLSVTSEQFLYSGTYYVHVGARDPSCTLAPAACIAWSDVQEIVLPPDPPTPPDLISVGYSGGSLTASWTLEPWMGAFLLEVATNDQVYPVGDPLEGAFLDEYYVGAVALAGQQTELLSGFSLDPGTYYVHVAAFDPSTCSPIPSCLKFSNVRSVTVTAPPPPAPPGPTGGSSAPAAKSSTPADRSTAFSSLKAASKQDIDKLFVQATMGETGTLSASGTVNVPGASKVFKFKTASASASAGKSVRLKLKLSKKSLRAVKRALKRKKKLKARIRITARDGAGNTKVEKRTIALRP